MNYISDEELLHYGVPGMKWGIRKDEYAKKAGKAMSKAYDYTKNNYNKNANIKYRTARKKMDLSEKAVFNATRIAHAGVHIRRTLNMYGLALSIAMGNPIGAGAHIASIVRDTAIISATNVAENAMMDYVGKRGF